MPGRSLDSTFTVTVTFCSVEALSAIATGGWPTVRVNRALAFVPLLSATWYVNGVPGPRNVAPGSARTAPPAAV